MDKIERLDRIPSCDALSITIGFDYSKESSGPCASDVACLSVVRKNGEKIELISQFFGEEALWLYTRLMNGPARRPLYMTMPKGLGLSEAKENFKRYINDMYGKPNSDCFQEFTKTFEGCDITINNPAQKWKKNFTEEQ